MGHPPGSAFRAILEILAQWSTTLVHFGELTLRFPYSMNGQKTIAVNADPHIMLIADNHPPKIATPDMTVA